MPQQKTTYGFCCNLSSQQSSHTAILSYSTFSTTVSQRQTHCLVSKVKLHTFLINSPLTTTNYFFPHSSGFVVITTKMALQKFSQNGSNPTNFGTTKLFFTLTIPPADWKMKMESLRGPSPASDYL